MIEERNGVRNWASILDEQTRQQAEKLARCPAVSGPVALMPDAHLGIGATVGSVIVTENAIIPAAVGVDIGCGMIACRTDLVAGELPDTLQPLISVFAKTLRPASAAGRNVLAHKVEFRRGQAPRLELGTGRIVLAAPSFNVGSPKI